MAAAKSRSGKDRLGYEPLFRSLSEVALRAFRAGEPAPPGRRNHLPGCRVAVAIRAVQGAGGKVRTGFCAKKSKGRRTKSCHITGMTGQSSARGTWWKPSVYQATMSVFSMGRLALVQTAKPSSPLLSSG